MSFDDKSKNLKDMIEEITKSDRSPLVRDLDYGEIESYNLQNVDVPVKSEIKYDENGVLIFENYEQLDEFLEKEFIPKHIAIKQHKVNGEWEDYFSIQLHYIIKLRLSEKEEQHVKEYLEENGIRIGGTSATFEGDNYDYIRTYKESPLPFRDSTFDDIAKIEEYRRTGDIKIKQQIVINNLRLVSFVAYKYSIMYKINIHELESFGYEGLMEAIERFEPSLATAFSTYAYEWIRGFILNGIRNDYGVVHREYYKFLAYKKVIEEETGKKVENSPELLDEIMELMISTGEISEGQASSLKNKFLIQTPTSFEEIEDIVDPDSQDFILDVEQSSLKDELLKVIETLTPRECEIIKERFGLLDGMPKTLEEVGDMFGVGRERVRQIEAKALRKLRHPARRKHLFFPDCVTEPVLSDLPQGKKI